MKNIWTNGCFDIIHAGHIELFKYAKNLGDNLYVGLDSDERIKKIKSNLRPINNINYRLIVLSAIRYIDNVFVFNNNQELVETIKKLNIDTIVIGDDYKNKNVIGSDIVNKVIFFSKQYDLSTTKLLNHA